MENTEELSVDYALTRLRKIRTARSLRAINLGVRQGFTPLLRKVVPSKKIWHYYNLVRNIRTGEIADRVDPRDEMYHSPSWKTVLAHKYYPYYFKSPYAAYLIPKDIQQGEEVLLLDLIEDFVGMVGPGGDTYRLESCRAIWNGTDLEIQYDPVQNIQDAVG